MTATVDSEYKLPSEEDCLLTRGEAAALLDLCEITFTKIVRIHTDSILYLNCNGKPMTAWLDRDEDDGGQIGVVIQRDWAAQPSVGLAARIVKALPAKPTIGKTE